MPNGESLTPIGEAIRTLEAWIVEEDYDFPGDAPVLCGFSCRICKADARLMAELEHLEDCAFAIARKSALSETAKPIPEEINEWIMHMDLHLTEHDERHAGLALRAAWPHVRKFFIGGDL